jgi:hypothetical protein
VKPKNASFLTLLIPNLPGTFDEIYPLLTEEKARRIAKLLCGKPLPDATRGERKTVERLQAWHVQSVDCLRTLRAKRTKPRKPPHKHQWTHEQTLMWTGQVIQRCAVCPKQRCIPASDPEAFPNK